MAKVKIKDIAEMAGVSPTAVSLVLNDKPCRISDETKEKIFRIAEELRFQQENYGFFRGFTQVKSLGLIVPEIENPFFAALAAEVSRCAWAFGYTVFQCSINGEFACFRNAVECLIGKNVDGVILIPPEQIGKDGIKLVKSLQKSRIPLVLLDRAVYSIFCDFVTGDNKYGGRLLTEYLLERGHQKIGMILGGEQSYTAKRRLEGYREALAKRRIPFCREYVFQGYYDEDTGYLGAGQLWQQGVTAVIAANDRIALGVYRYAAEQQLAIGRELSVVGYDNTPAAARLVPPLTSVDQNIPVLAETAVDVLVQRIETRGRDDGEPEPARNYYFAPALAERLSVSVQN